MGKIFSLDAGIKEVIRDALDDLLAELGKACRLVYPPHYVGCDNCVIDPQSGRSFGRYRHGGPMPFNSGKCPMCQGEGRVAREATEDVTLLCNWEPRKFATPIQGVALRKPYSLVEAKGHLGDLPKILKADHLLFQVPIAPYLTQRFRLFGEPGDRSNIIQDRYFVAVFERWDG